MKKTGYGPAVIKEGKDILASTWEIFDENLQRKDELSLARKRFSRSKAEIDSIFREHREKALILFRKDVIAMNTLGLKGKYPTKYAKWLEYMRAFYNEIVENAKIQIGFQRLNFTKEDALSGLDNIKKLDQLLADRIALKGISQNSTEQKNKAFAELNDWMSDFYRAARLALKKEPELLKALYKSV